MVAAICTYSFCWCIRPTPPVLISYWKNQLVFFSHALDENCCKHTVLYPGSKRGKENIRRHPNVLSHPVSCMSPEITLFTQKTWGRSCMASLCTVPVHTTTTWSFWSGLLCCVVKLSWCTRMYRIGVQCEAVMCACTAVCGEERSGGAKSIYRSLWWIGDACDQTCMMIIDLSQNQGIVNQVAIVSRRNQLLEWILHSISSRSSWILWWWWCRVVSMVLWYGLIGIN
jgi:hypothetical protein